MITLNNILDNFALFAQNHQQINSYGFGELTEIDLKKNVTYPQMWVNPTSATVEQGYILYQFQILFYDCPKEDESDEQEIVSNMQTLALDLISYIKNGPFQEIYQFVNGNQIQYFTERFDNTLTGVFLNLGIKVEFDAQSCDLPIDNFPLITGTTDGVTVIVRPDVFTTGATLSGTTAIFTRNDANNYNLDLSTLSGTTVTDFNLNCNTNEISLQQSNGDNYNLDLSCILSGFSTTDFYTTGATLSGTTAIFNRNDGNTYNLNLSALSSTITGTTGSVAFFGTGNTITQDNSNFFWNNTLKRLGLRTNSPNSTLQIIGEGTTSSTFGLQVHNSTGTNNALVVRDNGRVGIGTNNPVAQLHIQGDFPGKTGLVINGTNLATNNGSFAVWQNNGTERGYIYVADAGSDALRGIKISNPTATSEVMVAAGTRGVTVTNAGSFTTTSAFQTAVTSLLGTTTPLTIFGAEVTNANLASNINHIHNTNTVGRQSQVLHRFFTSTSAIADYGGFGTEITANTNTAHSGDLFFRTAFSGTFAERMRLKASGSLLIGTVTDITNSILTMQSTTRGFLPPRMTTINRDAVTWVAGDAGMVIYNTTDNKHQGWDGSTWNNFY